MSLRQRLARPLAQAAAWLIDSKQSLPLRRGHDRIAAMFSLSPAELGARFTAALEKGPAGWDAWGDLVAAYERYMLNDGYLKGLYLTLKFEVANLDWRIEPAVDDPTGDAIAEHARELIAAIPRRRRRLFYELSDSIGIGLAAVETFGELRADGAIYVVETRGVPQYLLRPDEKRPGQWEFRSELNWQPVPDDKLLVWTQDEKGEFKTSGLMWQSLWLALLKNFSFKDWVSFLETYGQPLRLGKYDSAASIDDQETLARAVIDIAVDAGAIIPAGMDIEFKEAMSGDSEAYERLIKRIDLYYAMLYTGAELSAAAGENGARSLGEVHERRNDSRVLFWTQDLAEVITAFLRDRIIANYGERPSYPEFQFVVDDVEKLIRRWQIDQGMIQAGLRIPARFFRETYGYPEPEGDEEVVTATAAQMPTRSAVFARGSAAPRVALSREPIEMLDGLALSGSAAVAPLYSRVARALADIAGRISWDDLRAAAVELTGESDLDRQKKMLAEFQAAAAARLRPAAADPLAAFAADLAPRVAAVLPAAVAAGIAETAADAASERVAVDRDAMLRETFAALGAKAENIPPAKTIAAAKPLLGRDSRLALANSPDWTAVTPQRAIDYWAQRIGMKSSVFKSLDPAAKKYAVSIANIESQSVIDTMVEGIRRALVDGESSGQFVKALLRSASEAGYDELNPSRAEFIYRQNLLTAYGAGRAASQHSPAVKKYLPYLQLLTVGDTHVRPEHRRLHGFTAPADDPVWSRLTPPLDYGCRCGTRSLRRPNDQSHDDLGDYESPAGFGADGPVAAWNSALAEVSDA